MTRILQTERLQLRPLSPNDAPALFPMYNDGQTMRFIPFLPHQTLAETHDYLTKQVNMPGAVHWAVCLRDKDEPIGVVNYLGQTRVPGMGYIIRRDYWGQGITAEACRAALDYGFDQLGLNRVELWIDEENAASHRVAHKLGFRFKGRISSKFAHKPRYHRVFVYGIRAHEWRGEVEETAVPQFFQAEPVLMVKDLAASVAFYRDKLGFHVDFQYGDPPFHAGVSRGEWTGTMTAIQLTQVPPERAITPSAYLHIFVDTQLETLYKTYQANGVEIVAEPTTKPWGLREFIVCDLDGHQLRLATQA